MANDTPSNTTGDKNHVEQAEAYSGASLADATGGAGAPPSEKLNFKDLNRQDVEAQDIDEGVDDDEDDDDDDKAFDDEYDQDSSYEDDYQDEMRKVPDEEKTPVTIVTGFLGAGKTTLVNYILKEQREMKIAVIENEYGAVSIDTALVQENVRETEDIVTMDNGCVCCTVRGDLVNALLGFLPRRHTFDCILIETTGIADPSPIVATFNQDLDVQMNYRIDSVLCLVDAKNILTQLARTPEEGAVNEAVQQLAFADTVVINKTDLVDESQLKVAREKINSVNAFARVIQSQKSRVPLQSVLNLKSYNLERTLELLEQEKQEEARKQAEKAKTNGVDGHSHQHEHKEGQEDGHKHTSECGTGCSHDHSHDHANGGEKRKREGEVGDATESLPKKPKDAVQISSTRHDSKVGSLGLTIKGSLDVDRFNQFMADFLRENSENLFRSKGVLSFANMSQKYVFQGVHEQINCEASASEWAKDGSDRETKIVFIGLCLDKDEIAAGLKTCLAPDETALKAW